VKARKRKRKNSLIEEEGKEKEKNFSFYLSAYQIRIIIGVDFAELSRNV